MQEKQRQMKIGVWDRCIRLWGDVICRPEGMWTKRTEVKGKGGCWG